MKSKRTFWAVSGLFLAAVTVAVIGFASVGVTSQQAQATASHDIGAAFSTPAQLAGTSGQHQTVRVFWPIWSGSR